MIALGLKWRLVGAIAAVMLTAGAAGLPTSVQAQDGAPIPPHPMPTPKKRNYVTNSYCGKDQPACKVECSGSGPAIKLTSVEWVQIFKYDDFPNRVWMTIGGEGEGRGTYILGSDYTCFFTNPFSTPIASTPLNPTPLNSPPVISTPQN